MQKITYWRKIRLRIDYRIIVYTGLWSMLLRYHPGKGHYPGKALLHSPKNDYRTQFQATIHLIILNWIIILVAVINTTKPCTNIFHEKSNILVLQRFSVDEFYCMPPDWWREFQLEGTPLGTKFSHTGRTKEYLG